ncbi:MAG: hypothetical protein U0R24_11375 [Solirubrobacterales bacterium]
MKGPLCIAAAALGLLFSATPALAAPGDLDPDFGLHGISPVRGGETVVIPNGKILARFGKAVTRTNPDGSLDTSFGAGGSASTGSVCDRDITVDSGGRILTTGTAYNGTSNYFPHVCRMLADGSPDSTFGDNGEATIDLGTGFGSANAVGVEQSGRILVGGQTLGHGTVTALLEDGSVDHGFADDGTLDLGVNGVVSALAQDDTGRWYAAVSYNGDMAVVRFDDGGVPDATYGENGTQRVPGGSLSQPEGILLTVAGDGRVAIGGTAGYYAIHGVDYVTWLSVLGPDGEVDSRFNAGVIRSPFDDVSGSQAIDGLTWDARGNLLVSGGLIVQNYPRGGSSTGYIARLRPDGQLDSTFGEEGGGLFPASFSTFPGGAISYVSVQPDGRIVGTGGITLVRFLDGGDIADADADALPDETDLCPRRYAETATGCELVHIYIDATLEHRRLTGDVSGPSTCVKEQRGVRTITRKVSIYRKIRGPDELVGRTQLSQRRFRMRVRPRGFEYYALMPRKLRPGVVICGRSRSGLLP